MKSKGNRTNHPTKYKPEFCKMLIEHMKQGFSFGSFAKIAGVKRLALYCWEEKYPEFKEAREYAEAENLFFWEDLGIKGVSGKVRNFNTTAWIFNMKNRHGWRDKQKDENDVVVNNNTTTTINEVPEKIEDVERRIEELMKKYDASRKK